MALTTEQALATLKRGTRQPRVRLDAWKAQAEADAVTDPSICALVVAMVTREIARRDAAVGHRGFRGDARSLGGRNVYWIP